MSSLTHNLVSAALMNARPRVMAALVRSSRDVDIAEDLYQEACLRAVRTWPTRGMPTDAVAWLIRVGRNAGIDQARKDVRVAPVSAEDVLAGYVPQEDYEAEIISGIDNAGYKDDVLRLLFMCCHEELSTSDQLALALKVVVGFSVAEISRALMVTQPAMEQRITRAKRRAASVATRLDTPTLSERAARLKAVCTMIYLLFNEGYAAAAGDAPIRHSLCEEAIRLARLLLSLFPGQTKVMGLLALCLLQHSRYPARLDEDGNFVALEKQDRSKWDAELIAEALVLVEKALRRGQPESMQIQAAIAAVHCSTSDAAQTDWAEIDRLYAALEIVEPSPVVSLNRAVAIAKLEGPVAALAAIEPLAEALKSYRPYHSTRAAFLEEQGDFAAAVKSYELALPLADAEADRVYLRAKILELAKNNPKVSDMR